MRVLHLVECASELRAIKALKHLHVYVVNAGISGRLHAKRTWTGPLHVASVVTNGAVIPRSRPEQQHTIEQAQVPVFGAAVRWHRRFAVVASAAGLAGGGLSCREVERCKSREDGEANAEAPSSTIRPRLRAITIAQPGHWRA